MRGAQAPAGTGQSRELAGRGARFDAAQSSPPGLLSAWSMDMDATGKTYLFRTLYEANCDRVRRLLGRMAGPQDAEDLPQIVFAKAAAALPQFRGEAQASTWLYRIAAHVASDWLRSRTAREAKLALHVPEGPDSSRPPSRYAANSIASNCPARRLRRTAVHPPQRRKLSPPKGNTMGAAGTFVLHGNACRSGKRYYRTSVFPFSSNATDGRRVVAIVPA